MSDLNQLAAQLEAGSTDLLGCLSSLPELARSDQVQLVLADQKYRVRKGEPASVEHYAQFLPWLNGEPELQQQIIANDFRLRLGMLAAAKLLAQFEANYARFGELLLAQFRSMAALWNQTPLDRERFDVLRDQFEEACGTSSPPRIEAYLQLSPIASHSELLHEFILIEADHRRKRGEPVEWEDYQRRFPEHIVLLEQLEKEHSVSPIRQSTSVQQLSHQTTPIDLSGSYISKYTIGDLRNGRYRLDRRLGEGAFGEVRLAQDMELKRQVTVKLPSRRALAKMVNVESYLVEAQNVAALDHPHIVTVYDVGRTLDGSVYVVSKFIDGCSLDEWVKKQPLDFTAIARLLERVAAALHHAHQRRFIHRDVKPANILIEEATGTPYVTDFGLAIREEDYLQEGRIAGTPAYMSPEQVRGEGHRLDGRSDLFSLGVVMYWLLTGQLPFRGKVDEIREAITTLEPPSPRSLKSNIPPELERICIKLLAKRASDRYSTGQALADDLLAWLAPRALPAAPSSSQQRITPRGLRSFTADDAGFFLELLPGARNREGLPESIAFWKAKLEQRDADQTFTVGLLYGPSGCGKSSLVKAGLIPSLSPEVIAIYIEATPEETESRLLQGLRKAIPTLSEDLGLVEALKYLRCSSPRKVVFFIDQFEQWLYAEHQYAGMELTNALRQCDGGKLQAIVMVREDFWISVSRFFKEMEIRILEGTNSVMVDLFGIDHAAKVLGLFGTAYGKLPESPQAWTEDQSSFIRASMAGLSHEGKVISVQISLLADMLKQKPWTTETLREVGGIEGVGITFLEEMFGSRHAPLQYRQHQEGVRGLLSALLPSIGTDIKGSMRSAAALQQAAGYERKAQEFRELLEILDKNLRLITAVDGGSLKSEGRSEKLGSTSSLTLPSSQFYQLTHDYLVPSLREWLTRKQRETRKGRAELKLAERTAVWSLNRENKQLPTLVEWFQIHYWTDKKRWTVVERSLMRTAARVHARNWGSSILCLLILGGIIGYLFQQQSLRSQQEKITVALDSLQKTLGPAVPVNIDKLLDMKRPDLIRPDLASRFTAADEPREKLSLAFALANFGQVEIDYLISQIDEIEDRDTANLITALGYESAGSIEKLRQAANECSTPELHRRKARLALAALGLGDTTVPIDACEFEGRPDPGVRTWFIDEFKRWELDRQILVTTAIDSSSPALRSAICLGLGQIPVKQISSDDKTRVTELANRWYSLPDSSTHSAVAWLMREWEISEPTLPDAKKIVNERSWFLNSQGVTFVRITPSAIEPKPLADPLEQVRQALTQMTTATPEEKAQADFLYWRGRNLFLVGQYESALADLEALLKMELDDSMSRLRDEIEQFRLFALARLKRTEEADAALAQWVASEPDTVYRDYVESLVPLWLGRKDSAIARLEQALAGVESADRELLYNLACAVALFAASEAATADEKRNWTDRSITLLELWDQNDNLERIQMREDPDLITLHSDPRFEKLAAIQSNIPETPYWLANRQVTRGEYESFLEDTRYEGEKPKDAKIAKPNDSVSPTLDHPAQNVSWYDAVMYCNWLSRREGRTPAYRYAGKQKFKQYNDQEVEVDSWEEVEGATGYRLPKEMEWEYACRAGSETDWSTGSDESLLASYCQMYPSKLATRSGKKLPNAWGIHDLHGNVSDWCWDSVDGSDRVYRGGSWNFEAALCRSASRNWFDPSLRNSSNGFRLALNTMGREK